jgi:hypothetical protein
MTSHPLHRAVLPHRSRSSRSLTSCRGSSTASVRPDRRASAGASLIGCQLLAPVWMKSMKMMAVGTTCRGVTSVSTSTRGVGRLMTFVSMASVSTRAHLTEMEVVATSVRITVGQGNVATRSHVLLCTTMFARRSAVMMRGGIAIDVLHRSVARNPLHLSCMRSYRFMCWIARPQPCHHQWTQAVKMCGRIPL